MNTFERITKKIEEEREAIIELTQNLVKIPSVVGCEGECQGFVRNVLEEMGLKVEVKEPDIKQLSKHPEYSDWSSFEDENLHGYKNRPNVIGSLPGTGGGKSLILNGHIDVVPVLRPQDWAYDPWGGTIAGDKLYGRGSSDMKAGVAAMIMAVKAILDSNIRLKGDIVIESVVDEEGGGNGTLDCFLNGYLGDAVLYPEPSQIYGVGAYVRVCGGLEHFRIRVFGKSGHPRMTWGESVNSIFEMTKIIKAIEKFNQFRQKRCKNAVDPDLAHFFDGIGKNGMVAIGSIRAGRWFAVMPDECILEGAVWRYPGEDVDEVKRVFIDHIQQCDLELKEKPPRVEWVGNHINPDIPVQNESFYRIAHECVNKILNVEPTPKGALGGSDQRIFSNYARIPTFQFGPNGGNVHANDEFVHVQSIVDITKIIALIILNWCKEDSQAEL